ncbi:MAG: polyisoprenoid-binding protein [Armatimonadetes bacterium]|nr:MAG: polyisoprenoid-binding protein [Armatimonadota bacterium]
MAIEKWQFDNVHSSINFSVRHMMISRVRGRFEKWTGTLLFDEENPTQSQVEVTIDAASTNTQEQQRDDHLRSPDFLDVQNYPNITFKSTAFEPAGENRFRVVGDLTIHGVTKPVTLDVEFHGRGKDPWGGERIGFSAKTKINRKDFGLEWNQILETGGVLVGEEVEIEIEVEAVKATEAAATQS